MQPPNSPDVWAILSSIGTFTAGIGTIALGFLALRGLNQWRAQLTGTSKYELARKLAQLAVQLQDEFREARSPLTFSNESSERVREQDESREEAQVSDEYYVRVNRLKPLYATLQQIRAAGWEADIILGREVRNHVDNLYAVVRDLGFAIQTHFELRFDVVRGRLATGERHDEDFELRRQIYGGGSDDEMTARMKRATDELLGYLQRYIK